MLIVVDNLIKAYEGRERLALAGVSFNVEEGECFGLLGPNGAGKTTILGCLLGLLYPDSGSVSIGGLPPDDLAVREVIGFLPERPNFESWFTAREYLKYHHSMAKQDSKTREQDVENTLKRVGLVDDAWDRPIKKFSRGMLQRIGLAQALIGKPRIVFLDEPGSGMDPPGVTLLREILLELKKEKVTTVLNSHHLDEMERVCDRVAFIYNGTIKEIRTLGNDIDIAYVLKLKWLVEDSIDESNQDLQIEPIKSRLETIVKQCQAELLNTTINSASIKVPNSRAAAEIIKLCVESSLPLISANPQSTTLEGMFEGTKSDE